MRKSFTALLLSASLSGCGGGESEIPPEVRQTRLDAARSACISNEIARRSEEELQTLEQSFGGAAPQTGTGQQPAASAVVSFARAQLQHAQLRMAAYAQIDSAHNASPTPADSARHAAAAAGFQIRRPEPGSLEDNVIQDYDRKFTALAADSDHPCNWKGEVEDPETES